MNWLIFILVPIGILANATMDELAYHWSRWFGHKITKPFLIQWMNPAVSWKNKYVSKYEFLTFVLSTALVMFTDLWHFLKFVFLNCIFLIILTLLGFPHHWWLHLIFMNLGWGVIFNFFLACYGKLSDKFVA
jgi:hypothetical protein